MQVIITSKLEGSDRYKNFGIRKEFRNITSELETIDVLVLHSTSESELDVGLALTEASRLGVKKFIYLNEKPNEFLSSCVRALGGIVLTDEMLLEEDMLEYLIGTYEDFKENTSLSVVDSVDILEDFIRGYSTKDPKINNEVYQERVKTALVEIRDRTKKAETTLQNISETTVDLFNDIARALNEYQKTRLMLEEKIYNLEIKIKEDPKGVSKESSVFYYPKVKYVGVNNILYIKEFAECRYLLSFLLAYQDYVENFKNKRAKIVILSHAFRDTKKRYSNAVTIDSDSVKHDALVQKSFLAVYQPKERVLERVLNNNMNITIVLDRMYCDEILTGACIRTLYATSGVEAMKRANIQEKDCILSGVSTKNLFMTIPNIENYPIDVASRKQAYYQTCSEQYEKLSNLLGV